MTSNSTRHAMCLAFATFFFALGSSAIAQIPDEFTNLQVLPKNTSKQQLIATMRSFAIGLGVRCEFCHVGEPGQPLSTFDFASDDKDTKKTARIMMRMVQKINNEHLAAIPDRSESPIRVKCVTCHRGQSQPRMLEELLLETTLAKGAEAGIQRYKDLRKAYYGGFTFDFSENVLNNLAQQLARQNQVDAALAFLEFNSELYPENPRTYFFMAELYAGKGEKDQAIANYEKTLELQPKNPVARQKLEALKK